MEPLPEQIERIGKSELRDKLQRGEDVIIVDARSASAYEASNIKPKGSVRIVPGASNGEISRLPRDKTIVTV
ncbi:MAG: hypothetical protein HYY30_04375 [Chloroflexi bacterium]|nr:hypothetical protein [Chloroflexota bacterium]